MCSNHISPSCKKQKKFKIKKNGLNIVRKNGCEHSDLATLMIIILFEKLLNFLGKNYFLQKKL